MANTLRFKRGLLAGLPSAAVGEPLFTTDTFDLYIGTASGTQKYQKFIASGTTSQLLRGDGSLLTMPIVLTSPSNGQVLKYNGTSWVNDSDAGITGSGTTNYLPKFTGASTLGNSLVFDNGTNVGIGTASPNGKLQINNGTDLNIAFNTVANDATTVSRISSINDAATLSTPLVINGSRLVFTTNAVEAMRITSTRNFIINNASTDNGLRFQVTGDGYFSGSVGIGTSGLTGVSLNVSKNITGAVASIGIVQAGQVQTDVTSAATGFRNLLNTAASTTLGDYYHIRLGQGTIGAGTTLTQQIGLYINDFANGTSRYGILSELSAGTGKWNLYMGGTAANYLNGSLAVGTTTFNDNLNPYKAVVFYTTSGSGGGGLMVTSNQAANGANAMVSAVQWGLSTGSVSKPSGFFFNYSNTTHGNRAVDTVGNLISRTLVGAANLSITNNNGYIQHVDLNSTSNDYVNYQGYLYVQRNSGTVNVNSYTSFRSMYQTAVGSETITDIIDFRAAQPTLSTGALVTNRYGLLIDFNNTQVTNAWGVYQSQSTVNNYMNGALLIGTTTVGTYKLDVNGTMRVSGASTFTTLTATSNNASVINARSGNAGGYAYYSVGRTSEEGVFGVAGAANQFFTGAVAGDVFIGANNSKLFFGTSASTAPPYLTLNNGAATFSSSVTGASFIPTSSSIPTNGMYLQQPNELAFSTNSAFRMAITSSFVSIGIANPSGGYGDGVGVELSPLGYIQSYRSQGVSATFGRHTTTGSIQTFFYGTTVGSPAQIGAIGTDGTGLTLSGGAFGTTHLTIASGGAATFSSTISSTGTNGFAIGNLTNTQRIQYGSDVATSFTLLTAANAYAGLYAGAVVLSGNLTVDTNTLFVDAANNRVGVKQSSPTSSLHVDGSNARSYVTKTANYTMTENDYTVLCDTTSGGFTITLPAASGCAGRIYCIKKTIGNSGVNNVTIDGNASETIDGSTTISLQCRSSVIIQSDGSNWWVLAEKNDASCI